MSWIVGACLDSGAPKSGEHELAGKDLNFDVTLRKVIVKDAIEREKHPAGCACGCEALKAQLA